MDENELQRKMNVIFQMEKSQKKKKKKRAISTKESLLRKVHIFKEDIL